jgi:hypothetical protein
MATLNTIADEIIGALQRPFDIQFRERVKSAYISVMATLIRRQIQKHGNDEQFSTHFYLDLVPKPAGPCNPGEPPSSKCWQSEFPLPRPIRTGSDVPFTFVGSADHRVSYIFTEPWELRWANMTEVYQDEPVRYYLNNSTDLVVCNIPLDPTEPKPEKICIHVEGAFSPGTVLPGKWGGSDDNEFHDDMVLPFPDDLIKAGKDMLLQGELSITDNKVAPDLSHVDNE